MRRGFLLDSLHYRQRDSITKAATIAISAATAESMAGNLGKCVAEARARRAIAAAVGLKKVLLGVRAGDASILIHFVSVVLCFWGERLTWD